MTRQEIVLKIGGIVGRPELVKLGALPYRAGDPVFVCADVGRRQDATAGGRAACWSLPWRSWGRDGGRCVGGAEGPCWSFCAGTSGDTDEHGSSGILSVLIRENPCPEHSRGPRRGPGAVGAVTEGVAFPGQRGPACHPALGPPGTRMNTDRHRYGSETRQIIWISLRALVVRQP